MFDVQEKPEMVERALLVRFYMDKREEKESRALLLELEELVKTLGIGVEGMELIHVRDRTRQLICGTGKAEEVKAMIEELNCDCLVIDNEVSPFQQRQWEAVTGVTVIDREEVILDIFAKRARTREAMLQVQLARMQYALPRMAKMWNHLDREGGGGGSGGGGASRGMGEQQIEVDRRLARKRIDRVRAELEMVRKQRQTQRATRQKAGTPHAAIVGYTNAGKSTLLNHLYGVAGLTRAQDKEGGEVLEADMLFATLDPTTRRVELSDGQPMLLTDTVGFVRNLPHRLVESFKATLEEAIIADFLIHVVDASAEEALIFHETTLKVLAELGAEDQQIITVFNKIDLVEDEAVLKRFEHDFPDAIFISASQEIGFDVLEARCMEMLVDRVERKTFRLPQSRGDLLSLLHQESQIISTDYEGNDVVVTASVPPAVAGKLKDFDTDPPEPEPEW